MTESSGDARRAALGFSSHTGWAAVVAVAGPRSAPAIVAKRRLDLARTFETGAVYHMGQGLPLDRAETLVRTSERAFTELARKAIADLAGELRARGLEPVASAVLARASRPLPSLASILRSHPLVHAAEAELYRGALLRASEACGIPAALVPARELAVAVGHAVRLPEGRVATCLAELGKASGRPWTRDQKEAALAAWLALALSRGARRGAGEGARPAR